MTPADVLATMREAADLIPALDAAAARYHNQNHGSGRSCACGARARAVEALMPHLRAALATVETLAQDAARLDFVEARQVDVVLGYVNGKSEWAAHMAPDYDGLIIAANPRAAIDAAMEAR